MSLESIIKNLQQNAIRQQNDTLIVRWSIFFIVLIVIWFWVLDPLQNWRASLQEQSARNAMKVVRLRALVEQADNWKEAEEKANQALEATSSAFFELPSDTAAQAKIQLVLQQLSEKRGVKIYSQRLLAEQEEPMLGKQLGIAMDLQGDLVDVLYLLDDLTKSEYLFQIRRWVLQPNQRPVIAQIVVAGFRPGITESQNGRATNEG